MMRNVKRRRVPGRTRVYWYSRLLVLASIASKAEADSHCAIRTSRYAPRDTHLAIRITRPHHATASRDCIPAQPEKILQFVGRELRDPVFARIDDLLGEVFLALDHLVDPLL